MTESTDTGEDELRHHAEEPAEGADPDERSDERSTEVDREHSEGASEG